MLHVMEPVPVLTDHAPAHRRRSRVYPQDRRPHTPVRHAHHHRERLTRPRKPCTTPHIWYPLPTEPLRSILEECRGPSARTLTPVEPVARTDLDVRVGAKPNQAALFDILHG